MREVLVVRAETDVGVGWGECAADVDPHYSPEFNDSARLALVDHLVPLLFAAGDDLSGAAVADVLAPVKGHRMAKEALEVAVLDAELRADGVRWPTTSVGSGTRSTSACRSASPTTPAILAGWVAEYLDEGYRRIKLKIEPGADVERVAAIRELAGDGFPLQVDANTAYRVTDAEHLARLDELDLLLIEQPLSEDDFVGPRRARPAADARRSASTSPSSRSPTWRPRSPWGLPDREHQARSGRRPARGPAHPRPLPGRRHPGLVRRDAGDRHRPGLARRPVLAARASRCPATRRPRTATTPPT